MVRPGRLRQYQGFVTSTPALESPEDLVARESSAWSELIGLAEALTPEEAARRGYYPDTGWSVKDVLAHMGGWLAEAGLMLHRIMAGTYTAGEVDIEAVNQRFFETMRTVEYEIVRTQCWASRARMLGVLSELEERGPEALWWIRKAGPDHYHEHLPRLRKWVQELRAAP
jgi:mycothiol maleylpyruvate isomerase-like protein